MRATQRRTAPPISRLLWAVLGLTGLAGFAACTDAIHLDPPGATSSGSGTGGAKGTGGGAAGSCRSNPQCALPTPVCDTVQQRCVMCLTAADCSSTPGLACSLGTCVCEITALTLCPTETPDGGTPKGPTCVDTQTSPINCGGCGMPCPMGCMAGTCPTGTGSSTSSGTGGTGGEDAGSSDAGQD